MILEGFRKEVVDTVSFKKQKRKAASGSCTKDKNEESRGEVTEGIDGSRDRMFSDGRPEKHIGRRRMVGYLGLWSGLDSRGNFPNQSADGNLRQ